jgi:hypothetical protein
MHGELDVNGQRFEISYDPEGYGEPWTTTVGHERVSTKTFASLPGKIRTAIKRQGVSVRIPFVAPDGRAGAVVGEHAGRRVSTIEWADGVREHATVNEPLRPDTDADRLRELVADAERTRLELMRFRTEHQLRDANGSVVRDTTILLRRERERLVAEGEQTPA